MKTVIFTLFLLSAIQLAGASISITTSFYPASVLVIPEDQTFAGGIAFTFTVTANPPSTCDFTYETDKEFTVEGSGGAGGTDGHGTVYFAKHADYELTPSIQSLLTASEACIGEQTTVYYQIILQDANDNVPYFEINTITTNKTENDADLFVTTLRVKDEDKSTQFNTDSLIFSIQDDYQGLFQLNGLGKLDGWYTVQLLLARPLDYEQMILHRVIVIAQDCKAGCTPALSAEAVVTISVNDAPDQSPLFVHYNTYVEIPENTPSGTPITQVTAVDGDIGINQPIQYSITDTTGWYQIDKNTGIITTRNLPDREDPSYQDGTAITITASEFGDENSASSVQITIRLTDVNDNPPTFSSSTYTGTVIETAPVGYPVTIDDPQLQVADLDEGDNAKYTLSIVEQDTPFKVNPTVGAGPINFFILVDGELDYETNPTYIITVHAEDAQDPSFSTEATITINLEDVNDN